jgi:hypothetical protein
MTVPDVQPNQNRTRGAGCPLRVPGRRADRAHNGAIVVLAALADHNRELLRSAATGEWGVDHGAGSLLDAARSC